MTRRTPPRFQCRHRPIRRRVPPRSLRRALHVERQHEQRIDALPDPLRIAHPLDLAVGHPPPFAVPADELVLDLAAGHAARLTGATDDRPDLDLVARRDRDVGEVLVHAPIAVPVVDDDGDRQDVLRIRVVALLARDVLPVQGGDLLAVRLEADLAERVAPGRHDRALVRGRHRCLTARGEVDALVDPSVIGPDEPALARTEPRQHPGAAERPAVAGELGRRRRGGLGVDPASASRRASSTVSGRPTAATWRGGRSYSGVVTTMSRAIATTAATKPPVITRGSTCGRSAGTGR